MADDRLRLLERRFKETGARDDEVHWLRTRVTYGELSSGRLAFAAWLGHEAAGEACPRLDREFKAEFPLARQLWALDWEACLRSLIVLVDEHLYAWEEGWSDARPRGLLEATRGWLASRDPEVAQATATQASGMRRYGQLDYRPGGPGDEPFRPALVAEAARRLALTLRRPAEVGQRAAPFEHAGASLEDYLRALQPAPDASTHLGVFHARSAAARRAARTLLRERLLGWALGADASD